MRPGTAIILWIDGLVPDFRMVWRYQSKVLDCRSQSSNQCRGSKLAGSGKEHSYLLSADQPDDWNNFKVSGSGAYRFERRNHADGNAI